MSATARPPSPSAWFFAAAAVGVALWFFRNRLAAIAYRAGGFPANY